MMVKKQTIVQDAEEKANSEATDPQLPAEQVSSAAPFDRAEIEKAFNNPMLKGFKKYLDPILGYMESVEARLQAADQNFALIQQSFNKLDPLIKLSEQVAQRQAQPQLPGPSAPSGGDAMQQLVRGILQAAQTLGITGVGGDSELAELGKNALKAQINMSNAITNAVVAKITGKATTEVAEAVTGA